jgi:ferredoxin
MAKVDKKKCLGCGACATLCPEVFGIGDDGKAKVKSERNSPCVKDAIEGCPVDAISE